MGYRPIKPLPDNLPPWVPITTIADIFGADTSYVSKWFRLGRLKGQKIRGRWYTKAEDLTAIYESGEGLTVYKKNRQEA